MDLFVQSRNKNLPANAHFQNIGDYCSDSDS